MASRKDSGPENRIIADKRGKVLNVEALDVALDGLLDRAEEIHLTGVDQRVQIRPCSANRLERVENLDFWLALLAISRMTLSREELGTRPNAHELMDRFQAEIEITRSRLLWEVMSPRAGMQKEPPPEWVADLSPLEVAAINQGWHRCNLDLIRQLPKGKSRDGKRDMPAHLAFLLSSVAWREKRPVTDVAEDRSLVSIASELSLETVREHLRPKPQRRSGTGKAKRGAVRRR